MTRLGLAHEALYVVFAILAWLAWRRDRRLGVLAGYVTWMVAVDLVRAVLGRFPRGPHPLHGLARARFHLEEWMYLGASFLFVAVCVHYFVGRRGRAVLLLWAVAVAWLCWSYPASTGAPLLRLYSFVSAACLFTSVACVVWGLFVRRELELGLAHLVLLLYLLTDAARRAFSYATLMTDWGLVQVGNVTLLVACCLAHVWWLLKHPARVSGT